MARRRKQPGDTTKSSKTTMTTTSAVDEKKPVVPPNVITMSIDDLPVVDPGSEESDNSVYVDKISDSDEYDVDP